MTDHKHSLKVQPRGLYEHMGNTLGMKCETCGFCRWFMRGSLHRLLRGKSMK